MVVTRQIQKFAAKVSPSFRLTSTVNGCFLNHLKGKRTVFGVSGSNVKYRPKHVPCETSCLIAFDERSFKLSNPTSSDFNAVGFFSYFYPTREEICFASWNVT